jgi:plastocyanin
MAATLPRLRPVPLAVLALPVALALLAALAAPALAANVRLTDSGFEPRQTTVQPGETVVWTNSTEGRQTITGADGSWDSGPLGPGETFSVQLRQPGTITFRTADGSATGTVVVAAAAPGSTAAPAPDVDPGEPALPRTGLPLLSLGALGLLLVLAGAYAVRRADA